MLNADPAPRPLRSCRLRDESGGPIRLWQWAHRIPSCLTCLAALFVSGNATLWLTHGRWFTFGGWEILGGSAHALFRLSPPGRSSSCRVCSCLSEGGVLPQIDIRERRSSLGSIALSSLNPYRDVSPSSPIVRNTPSLMTLAARSA